MPAITCFGINSGAYVSEIIRAGIESIDRGQFEAGQSLGLSQGTIMKSIILPQAIKNILPALGNEFITLIKETAVAGAIAVTDVTKAAQYIGSRTWDVLPPLFIAAGIYLIIVLGLTKRLECLKGDWQQVITTKNLCKSFDENTHVLKGISETINKGEKVVVIGPSGSGKSTFLRCLNLLETPTQGEIWFEGENITDPKCDIQKIRPEDGNGVPAV